VAELAGARCAAREARPGDPAKKPVPQRQLTMVTSDDDDGGLAQATVSEYHWGTLGGYGVGAGPDRFPIPLPSRRPAARVTFIWTCRSRTIVSASVMPVVIDQS
jgi:hypothetical protein